MKYNKDFKNLSTSRVIEELVSYKELIAKYIIGSEYDKFNSIIGRIGTEILRYRPVNDTYILKFSWNSEWDVFNVVIETDSNNYSKYYNTWNFNKTVGMDVK